MRSPSQSPLDVDPFAPVLDFVAAHLIRMRDLTNDLPLEQLEPQLLVDGREYARQMLQARLNARALGVADAAAREQAGGRDGRE